MVAALIASITETRSLAARMSPVQVWRLTPVQISRVMCDGTAGASL